MNNKYNLVIETAVANNCEAMEADTIKILSVAEVKNGQSLKSHMSRRNFFTRGILPLIFFIIIVFWSAENSYAQLFSTKFDCKSDKLHAGVIQFSSDPSSLILGQSCQISIFKSNGKKIENIKDFTITSDNRNVRSSGLNFSVDNSAKGEPWLFVDGRLIEEEGNITISINNCNQSYTFPFQIRQSYVFDKDISCKGDRREFAIAPYKNSMNKNLYVVLDISRNQLYLMGAPISIDASGVSGRDGAAGARGRSGTEGTKGTEKNPNGGNGTDGSNGSNGGDGGDGSNGGEITVYMAKNTPNVVRVNVEGGRGGFGGAGGRGGTGGRGGDPHKVPDGTEKNLFGKTVTKYKDVGNKGNDGKDGVDGTQGRDGQHGQSGNFTFSVVDDLNKYFENIQHSHFKIENIVE